MKKNLKVLLIITVCLIASGCEDVSLERGAKFNKVLMDEEFISEDYKQIDVLRHTYQAFSGGWGCADYYYIYENDNKNLMAVSYAKEEASNDKYYVVYVYNDIVRNDVEERECSSSIEIEDSDGKCYRGDKYSIDLTYACSGTPDNINAKKYKINKKGFLFIKYELEEMN